MEDDQVMKCVHKKEKAVLEGKLIFFFFFFCWLVPSSPVSRQATEKKKKKETHEGTLKEAPTIFFRNV